VRVTSAEIKSSSNQQLTSGENGRSYLSVIDLFSFQQGFNAIEMHASAVT